MHDATTPGYWGGGDHIYIHILAASPEKKKQQDLPHPGVPGIWLAGSAKRRLSRGPKTVFRRVPVERGGGGNRFFCVCFLGGNLFFVFSSFFLFTYVKNRCFLDRFMG